MPIFSDANKVISGGLKSITLTQTASATSTTNTSSFSFSSQSIGAADSSRIVVVCVAAGFNGFGGSQPVATAFTIGGVTATNIQEEYGHRASGDQSYCSIFAAAVPTGTTATVAITFNGAIGSNRSCNICVYTLTGDVSTAATDSAETFDNSLPFGNINVSVDTYDKGATIGVYGQGETSTTTVTWTNLTEDTEIGGNSFIGSFASDNDTGDNTGLTVTASTNDGNWGGGNCMAVASWQPV